MTTRSQARVINEEEVRLLAEQLENREARIEAERRQMAEKERESVERLNALEREKQEIIRKEEQKTRAAYEQIEQIRREKSDLENVLKALQDQVRTLTERVNAPRNSDPPNPSREPTEERDRLPSPADHSIISNRTQTLHDSLLNPRDILDQIPAFDGSNIPIHRFTRACAEAAESLSQYPEKVLVKFFKQKIRGTARSVVDDVDFRNLAEFVDILKRTFSSNKSLNDYRGELANLFQHPGESILEYTARTKTLKAALLDAADQKYHGIPHYLRSEIEEDVLEAFIRGTQDHIRSELRSLRCFTLTDAVAHAARISRERNAFRSLVKTYNEASRKPRLEQKGANTPNNAQPNTPPRTTPQQTSAPASTAPQVTSSAAPTPQAASTDVCKYCKNPGHTIQTCRKLAYKNQLKAQEGINPVNFIKATEQDDPGPSESTTSS